jgi:hypothetical protein
MDQTNEISVTSHVARDLLSSSAMFKTVPSAIWEYVVNSLQYVQPGVAARVNVRVESSSGKISISDNGVGMNSQDLQRFFQMHGQNLERLRGRAGRGKFGTGKSAAFGIGRTLDVDTVRSGVRNKVKLELSDIESSGGEHIPVEWVTQDQKTEESDGTVISISNIFARRMAVGPIIEYIERNLQAFRASTPEVAVNRHICVFKEPDSLAEHVFEPSKIQAEILGSVKLVVRVAKAPLDESLMGISVTSGHGNMVGRMTAGIERKEHGSRLWGEIDIPAIETYPTPIEPFDSSRSLSLNVEHPVVAVLATFVGSKLETIRKEIENKEKGARQTERNRRLQREADRIAEILNDDFRRIKSRLDEINSAARNSGSLSSTVAAADSGDEEPSIWVEGLEEPGNVPDPPSHANDGDGKLRDTPNLPKSGVPDVRGKQSVDPAGGDGSKRRPQGGFRVVYRDLGENSDRSIYDSGTLTIQINTANPTVTAALGSGGIDDPAFKRLSYEIAFSEYAIGLGYELLKQDPGMPGDEVLFDVRDSLNRVSAAAAHLYA